MENHEKTEKLDYLRIRFSEKLKEQQNVALYCDSGGFHMTEWSGKIFCVEIDPASPIFCLTE
jgi:hypothetical protein